MGFERAARARGKAAIHRSSPSGPGPVVGQPSWPWVIRHALCRYVSLDPDQWFPASVDTERARHEAAAAIAICQGCPVRAQCLAMSLRHWDIGQHGVWGGLVSAERATLRDQVPDDRTRHRGAAAPDPRDRRG
jgi:WhiB family redox-sensing transcriptional regulator